MAEEIKNPLLQVKDLEVSFFTNAGEVKAVRKISYDLKFGEIIGIVGELVFSEIYLGIALRVD